MMELKFTAGQEWLIVKKALLASLAKNEKELHAILAKERELTSYKEVELAELIIKRDVLPL